MGFTRKEAKELLLLSDNTLKELKLTTNREVIRHYADGGDVEFYYRRWTTNSKPFFAEAFKWRKVELSEIEVLGVKVRARPPMSEAPEVGGEYCILNLTSWEGITIETWDDCEYDRTMLKRGLCWLKEHEEDAKKVASALIEKLESER